MEWQIMDLILRGEHPILALLRKQLAVATVSKRDFTGVGFFTYFDVAASAPRLPHLRRVIINDVHADVSGLRHGAGFALFVENGVLHNLECFIYEEAWPTDARLLRVYYMRPREPGGGSVVETQERDLEWAIREKRV
jgi:hypothetical protein